MMSTHFYSCRQLLGLQVQRFVEEQQVSLKWITQGLSNSGRNWSKVSLSRNPAIKIQEVSCVPNTPNLLDYKADENEHIATGRALSLEEELLPPYHENQQQRWRWWW